MSVITLQGPSVCAADTLRRRWTDNGAFTYREEVMLNWGADVEMWVGHWQANAWREAKLLMKWDLSSIPAGSTINTATLQLYVHDATASGFDCNLYGMTKSYTHGSSDNAKHVADCAQPNGGSWWCDYDIGSVTYWYRTRPGSTQYGVFSISDTGQACHPGGGGCDPVGGCATYCWKDEGGPAPGTDCDASYTDQVGMPGVSIIDTWVSFDAQALVSDWVNGVRSNYGLFLRRDIDGTNEHRRIYMRSPDYAADATKQPKLVIDYQSPQGAVIMVV